MYTHNSSCCCDNGLKKAICIINEIIDNNLVDELELNYSCNDVVGTLKNSIYPNLIHFESENQTDKFDCHICVSDINFFKITPTEATSNLRDYQTIINILNKYYQSPFCLYVDACNENCCCSSSFALYLKDKYIAAVPEDRRFHMKFFTNADKNTVPNLSDEISPSYVEVIYLDNDIAWVLDPLNQNLYLVSLCKICNIYTTSGV